MSLAALVFNVFYGGYYSPGLYQKDCPETHTTFLFRLVAGNVKMAFNSYTQVTPSPPPMRLRSIRFYVDGNHWGAVDPASPLIRTIKLNCQIACGAAHERRSYPPTDPADIHAVIKLPTRVTADHRSIGFSFPVWLIFLILVPWPIYRWTRPRLGERRGFIPIAAGGSPDRLKET